MIQPTTQFTVLLLLAIAAMCWGSWASTFKVTKKWRFEYFYYDFTVGMLLTTVIAAFTLGTMNAQELTFQDNFLLAAYRKIAWALGSGLVLNLGTILLLAATAICGMSLAFPVALGTALVVGGIFEFAFSPQVSLLLLFGGAMVVMLGVIANILAYAWRQEDRAKAAQKALTPDPRARNGARRNTNSTWRGVILALIAGLVLSAFPSMVAQAATPGATGVSPYGTAVLIAAAAFASSMLFVPFFLFFPVLGQPGQIRGYFNGAKRQHTFGILGGIIWAAGLLATLLAAGAPAAMQPGQVTRYALDHAALLIAGGWGLLVWREFNGATYRVRMMLIATMILFVAGASLVAIAPVYGR